MHINFAYNGNNVVKCNKCNVPILKLLSPFPNLEKGKKTNEMSKLKQ